MRNYHKPLLPGHSYHLFSRAVGEEQLFTQPANYLYFLQKLKEHTAPVCRLWAYSLLPNHFHLFARIAEEESLIFAYETIKEAPYEAAHTLLSDFVMERFSNWLNGYTKAYNKLHHRRGSLFMDYIRRSPVETAGDFGAFVWYVHKNAVHHGLTKAVGEWPYDSYPSLISEAPTALLRAELMEWFGGKEAFLEFHRQPVFSKKS